MFITRNRDEYREYLIFMERGVKTRLAHATKVNDKEFLKGQLYGLSLALDGLDSWEKVTTEGSSIEGTEL